MTKEKSNLEKFEEVRFNLSVATIVVLIIVAILRTDSNLAIFLPPITCPRDFFDPGGSSPTIDPSTTVKTVNDWSANLR